MVKGFNRVLLFLVINTIFSYKYSFADNNLHDLFLKLSKKDLELISSDPEIFLKSIQERLNLFAQQTESIDKSYYYNLEAENFDLDSIKPADIINNLSEPKEKPEKMDVNKVIAIMQANNRRRDIAIKTIQNNNRNRDSDIKLIKDKLDLLQSKLA